MLADTRHSGLLFLGVWFRPPVGGCLFGVACSVAFGVYVCLLSWSCCWPVSLFTPSWVTSTSGFSKKFGLLPRSEKRPNVPSRWQGMSCQTFRQASEEA